MAHFQYPMRNPTAPEKAAFAYPKEEGFMRAHHSPMGIDVGARLVVKSPFLVDNYTFLPGQEFVVTEKAKSANRYTVRCLDDNRISMTATTEEIDTRFYASPGQERPVPNAESKKLLGR